jgi:hypothetical protein
VGYYLDNVGYHGFFEAGVGGNPATIDFPGATGTITYGINNLGQIVGSYLVNGVAHGFLLSSAGAYTTVDVPGASSTYITGSNDAGQLIGGYYDSSGNEHAFFASPIPEPSSALIMVVPLLLGFAGGTVLPRRALV